MAFPKSDQLKKMRQKLENAEGTLMISPDASPLEKLRWDLCQKFVLYKKKHRITQDEMAEILGVDKAKVSKILRYRIDEFSTDRLITLYQLLNPATKIRVI